MLIPPAPVITAAHLVTYLRGSLDLLPSELRLSSNDVVSGHPAPAEWCAKECVGHLIEVERHGFNGMIAGILKERDHLQPDWDPDAVHATRNDCAGSVEGLMTEFVRLREDSIAILSKLDHDDLHRSGTHRWRGPITVGGLLRPWLNHERMHFRQALATLDAVGSAIACDLAARGEPIPAEDH
ncbi:MAG: DinB family protein [Chloroflexi bacterium]|nr:DinB family protein [Chloroflexota bacterium]